MTTRNKLITAVLALALLTPGWAVAQVVDGAAPAVGGEATATPAQIAVEPAAPLEVAEAPGGWMRLLAFAGNAFSGAGAPFMWAILMVSAFAVTVAAEKTISLFIRASREDSEVFREVLRLVRENRVEEARALADGSRTPFALMAQKLLRVRHGHSREELQSLVDEAYLAETPAFHRRLPLLAVSANLATLLGLLGTIVGLILAFEAVAHVAAAQRTAALAGGISVAMATTGFGLLVAIPTLAVHGLLGARADRAVEEIESRLAVLANAIGEWNRKPQADPFEQASIGIAETEKKIADYVTAGEA